jgi:hypothetical protein
MNDQEKAHNLIRRTERLQLFAHTYEGRGNVLI